ncbi:SOSS complex subunit C-like isoform X1 [Branchiostoma floridae]|uniref:SOSS complex subunit C n=2 Tax=Branchiostoma TaxID=7737 RepID=A0A9J7MH41_BRAFL|nr:PREDICTED: SOSS complex subunit C-like [Branchiostoma belcheri]XP_035700050.1 SOSS complex subunit C-like isoform X1 [Branchiostoma floridae]
MASTNPNSQEVQQNRSKILADLQQQKKKLMQRKEPTGIRDQMEVQHMNQAQRQALQHAHANSFGYFVPQDSSFGNLILPVLPRVEDSPPPT